MLEYSLCDSSTFLPGHPDRMRVMDRLHAFCYFLEGLLPRAREPRCCAALRDGIVRVAALLRDIAPEFERSDVYAQLLRARIYADRGLTHAPVGPAGLVLLMSAVARNFVIEGESGLTLAHGEVREFIGRLLDQFDPLDEDELASAAR